MTAATALASIREDLAALEAKNPPSLRPGFFRRRRAEADAIERELMSMELELASHQHRMVKQAEDLRDSDLRIGILANVLIILGFPIRNYLTCPIIDADVYELGAELITQARRETGTLATVWREGWSWAQRTVMLRTTLYNARIILSMKRHRTTDATKPKEESRAA